MFDFVLFYYYPVEVCLFLMRDGKGMDPYGKAGKEELGGQRKGKQKSEYII